MLLALAACWGFGRGLGVGGGVDGRGGCLFVDTRVALAEVAIAVAGAGIEFEPVVGCLPWSFLVWVCFGGGVVKVAASA